MYGLNELFKSSDSQAFLSQDFFTFLLIIEDTKHLWFMWLYLSIFTILGIETEKCSHMYL